MPRIKIHATLNRPLASSSMQVKAATTIQAHYRGWKVRQEFGNRLSLFSEVYPRLAHDVCFNDLWPDPETSNYGIHFLADRQTRLTFDHRMKNLPNRLAHSIKHVHEINGKMYLFDRHVIQTAQLITRLLDGYRKEKDNTYYSLEKNQLIHPFENTFPIPATTNVAVEDGCVTIQVFGLRITYEGRRNVYKTFSVEMNQDNHVKTQSSVRIDPVDKDDLRQIKRGQRNLEKVLAKHPDLPVAGHFQKLKASIHYIDTIGLQDKRYKLDMFALIFNKLNECSGIIPALGSSVNSTERIELMWGCARVLKAFQSKKRVHGDVKDSNILIKQTFHPDGRTSLSAHLTDHEFAKKTGELHTLNQPYGYWDSFKTHMGGVSELIDIYGLAVTLGNILLGNYFYERAMKGPGFTLTQYELVCAQTLLYYLNLGKPDYPKAPSRVSNCDDCIDHLKQLQAQLQTKNKWRNGKDPQKSKLLDDLLQEALLFKAVTELLKTFFDDQLLIDAKIKSASEKMRLELFSHFCQREFENLDDTPFADALKRSLTFMDEFLRLERLWLCID